MTYVQNHQRIFGDRSLLKPERRRSESRLKTYPSSEDLRNWCGVVEDRRQHITELIAKDIEKCTGKLIPIEVIIDTLMAAKNLDINNLKSCLKKLWDFISTLNLSEIEFQRLYDLKQTMDQICLAVAAQAEALKAPVCDPECIAKERHAKEQAEIEALIKTSSEDTRPTIRTKFEAPGRMVTRIKGLEPGFTVEPAADGSKPGNIKLKAQGSTKLKLKIHPQQPEAQGSADESKASGKQRQVADPGGRKSEYLGDVKAMDAEGGGRVKREVGDDVPGKSNVAQMRMMAYDPTQSVGSDESASVSDKLAATQALCKEQQDVIKNLQQERDDLKGKLSDCLNELENFKKLSTVANPALPSSCQQEIEALEAEIKIMRSGNPSPEEEASLIKKEVEVLKRYCSKLKQVEDENEQLKMKIGDGNASGDQQCIIDDLKGKLQGLDQLTKDRDALANKVHYLEKQLMQYQDLPDELDVLKSRSDMLDGVLKERDDLGQKVKQIKDMEKELAKLRQKAERVDELERELKNYSKGQRGSDTKLMKTQSRSDNLEKVLSNANAEKVAMANRIESMKKELDNNKAKMKEAEMFRLERDRLQIKLNELNDIQVQYDSMMEKLKIFDSVKAERDMYMQKYQEVLDMECRCHMLQTQVDEARVVERERDQLQKQVQDLQSCICDQQVDIKNMTLQLNNLSKTGSIGDANNMMRSLKDELNTKNKLLSDSEDRIATEMSRVQELESMLHDAQHTILQKDCHIKCLENQSKEKDYSVRTGRKLNKREYESVEFMKQELEAAKAENKKLQDIANKMISLTGDEHVKKMLQQSECAVRRVVQELDKQYREWDNMKQKKGKSSSNKKACLCQSAAGEMSGSDDCEKLRMELTDLQKEKQNLQQTLKNIQAK